MAEPKGLSDIELVTLVLEQKPGWEDAWWCLVRHAQLVVRQVAAGLGEDPRSLCLELLSRLERDEWRPLRRFQQDSSAPFAMWVSVMLRRLPTKRRRATRKHVDDLSAYAAKQGGVVIGSLADMPDEEMPLCVHGPAAQQVQQALSQMRHLRCQEIIRRYYYRHESFDDIAAVMHVRRDLVRQMHHQNRRMLGHALQQYQREAREAQQGTAEEAGGGPQALGGAS